MLNQHQFHCSWGVCESSFPTELELWEHAVSRHCNPCQPPLTCEWRTLCASAHCGRGFIHRGHLRDHLSSHFTARLAVYPCERCDQKFKNRQQLWRHVKKLYCGDVRAGALVISPKPAGSESSDECASPVALSPIFNIPDMPYIISTPYKGVGMQAIFVKM